jgi:biotin transport system substrate-specific component
MENISKTISINDIKTKSSIFAQSIWITTFAGLTAVGAQIEIPHYPIPFTLQTFFVLLAGAFLGSRNGFSSQILYLFVGAIGLPVFSGGAFGIVKLFGPTGGYLLSFPVAAAVVGYLVHLRNGYSWSLISFFTGLTIIFTSGFLYLHYVFVHNFEIAFVSGFLIFSWWDLLKLTAAAAIYNEFSKRFKKLPPQQ